MPKDAMPLTALLVLGLLACGVGMIGAIFTASFMVAFYRDRKDVKRAKAIAAAKKEMKDRARRLKEEEAKKSAEDDDFFLKYKEFVDEL
jgi:hypothetical protein